MGHQGLVRLLGSLKLPTKQKMVKCRVGALG